MSDESVPRTVFIETDGLSPEALAELNKTARNHNPLGWAEGKLLKGEFYLSKVENEGQERLAQAGEMFREALLEYTKDNSPKEWAACHLYLGQVHLFRDDGFPKENIETCIDHIKRSLEVYTFSTDPNSWIMAHYLLARAYRQHTDGNRAHDLKEAITHISLCLSPLGPRDPEARSARDLLLTELSEIRKAVDKECGDQVYDFFIAFHSRGYATPYVESLDFYIKHRGFRVHIFLDDPIEGDEEHLYRELDHRLYLSRNLIVIVDRSVVAWGAKVFDWVAWEMRSFLCEPNRRVFVIHVGGILPKAPVDWGIFDAQGDVWHIVDEDELHASDETIYALFFNHKEISHDLFGTGRVLFRYSELTDLRRSVRTGFKTGSPARLLRRIRDWFR